jgi:hypothetical protein
MSDRERRPAYEPLSVARLGVLMADADESRRWRLVAEFLEDYRWEPPDTRHACSQMRPRRPVTSTGTSSSRRWPSTSLPATDARPQPGPRNGPCCSSGSRSTPGPPEPMPSCTPPPPSVAAAFTSPPGTGGRVTEADPLLDRAAIQDAFRRLGERLARRGVVADIYVIGGAAMTLAYDARRSTLDIDAVFQPHGVVLEEAWAVADELGLPRWWLNEQASSYTARGGDQERPPCLRSPRPARLRSVTRASPRHEGPRRTPPRRRRHHLPRQAPRTHQHRRRASGLHSH